jgi:hypothetical protein
MIIKLFKKGHKRKKSIGRKSCKTIFERNNVVYNLNCGDCNRVYTRETKRKLDIRIKEHKNVITKLHMTSHVADHMLEKQSTTLIGINLKFLIMRTMKMRDYF